MKTSASLHLLPFEVEEILLKLGGRVAAARKARELTQQDLAAKAGIGLNTMVSIEKGASTVQFGFWLNVLWALDLLDDFSQLSQLGHDSGSVALLEASLPQRVRRKRARQGAA